MTKPTEGPYTIVHNFNVMGADGRRGVATCGGTQSNTKNETPENEANARLVRASWEMYRLLKDLGERDAGEKLTSLDMKRIDGLLSSVDGQ